MVASWPPTVEWRDVARRWPIKLAAAETSVVERKEKPLLVTDSGGGLVGMMEVRRWRGEDAPRRRRGGGAVPTGC